MARVGVRDRLHVWFIGHGALPLVVFGSIYTCSQRSQPVSQSLASFGVHNRGRVSGNAPRQPRHSVRVKFRV